ncbi:MAG: hypothetical protein IH999_01215 [Proteobacteria bacterium]|nr:hypothetical protein [Pseudomonadota bacterium]
MSAFALGRNAGFPVSYPGGFRATSGLDIHRAAHGLIEQHGDAADIDAARRADELLDAGDMDGRAVWLKVLKAVEELLDKGPPQNGATVH